MRHRFVDCERDTPLRTSGDLLVVGESGKHARTGEFRAGREKLGMQGPICVTSDQNLFWRQRLLAQPALKPPLSLVLWSRLICRFPCIHFILYSIMSELSMLSDDDGPLRAQPGPSNRNGTNGHVATNGNGHYRESSPLSDDDDMPLVSQSTSFRLYWLI